MNKPKRQGTAWESTVVTLANTFGLEAERIAEGGSNDLGDVYIYTDDQTWVVEAKHRDRLNIHETVHKARQKAKPYPAVVWWKRSTRKAGNDRRSMVGVPVVAMDIETFLKLIGGTTE